MNYFQKRVVLCSLLLTQWYTSSFSSDSYQLRDALIPSEVYNTQIAPSYIYSWPYNITTPGYYIFVTDMYIDSTSNNQVGISISPGVSNVIIDFNTYRISQHSPVTSTGTYGIYIAPGCSNIEIRNGSISSINGVGIYVDSQTSNINIYNLAISALQGTGIFTNGTNGFYCSDVSIDTVMSNTNTLNATGISCNNSNTVIIHNSNVSNTTAPFANSYGMSFSNCSAIQVNGSIVDNTQSGGLSTFGYLFSNCNGALINNCTALSIVSTFTSVNSSLLSSLLTPLVASLAGAINIQNLVGLNTTPPASSTGPVNLAAGFAFNNCSASLIKNSKAIKSIAGSGIAYGIVSNNGADNHFTNNEIIANLGGVNGNGCALLGAEKRSVINATKISGNIGTAGVGAGIFVSSLSTYILVNNNVIINHNASANGIGIYDGLGSLTTNRFYSNFLTNNTVGISFTSANAPVFAGPTSSNPSTYQNTVL